MKTYLSEVIPKIQRFSKKLDNLTLLTNQHWVILDDIEKSKNVYIFRTNGEVLISKNGMVSKGNWEFLGNNTLLIDHKENSYLYKHGFFDENILALKIDGLNEYTFLVNETRYDGELDTFEKMTRFLEKKYLRIDREPSTHYINPSYQAYQKHKTIHDTHLDNKVENNEEAKEETIKGAYKVIRKIEGWSFTTGKYIEYHFKFGKDQGCVIFNSKKNKYSFTTYADVIDFIDLDDCIKAYIDNSNS